MSFTPSGDQSIAIDINAEDNASGAFNQAGDAAVGMKQAVGAAGGVLAGLGVAAFGKAADAAVRFEKAMADVEKVTNAKVASEMSSEIRELATEIPLAQEELATLATQAGRMGAEGTEEIRDFTEVAGKMGAATTLSSKEAGTALGKMSAALGEPLGNAEKLGDAINEVSNNFQANSSEIVDSAQRSGQALSTLGLTSEEIIGLSGAFNEVSPTSRRAAMRMKQVSESMMNPDNVGLFAEMLGVSADEFTRMREESPEETMMSLMDAVDGNRQAMNILNEELTKSQARAFRDTAQSADTMREAMETSNTAAEEGGSLAGEVAVETDTMAGKMKLLKSELNNVAISMGNAFLPVLLDIVEVVSPMVSMFADLNSKMGGMPAVITAATAAIGGLTIALTAMTGVAATTILPIIAAVALLGATAYAVHKAWQSNMGGIRDAAQKMWKAVKPAIQSVKRIAKEVFQNYVMPMLTRLRILWEKEFAKIMTEVVKTMDVISKKITKVLAFLGKYWKSHGDQVMTYVKMVFGFLELVIGTAMRAISANIRIILSIIRGDFSGALDIIKSFWKTTFSDIVSFVKNEFMAGIKAGFNAFFGFVKGIFNKLYTFLIGNSIVPKTFNAILAFIGGFISKTIAKFKAFFVKMKKKWKNGLLAVVNWLKTTGKKIFGDAFGAIASVVEGVVDSMISSIKDGITGMIDWMASMVDDAIADAADRIEDAIPDSIDIPDIPDIGGSSGSSSGSDDDDDDDEDNSYDDGGASGGIGNPGYGTGLANGGIVTDTTQAIIGEAGDNEAVMPLHKLSQFLDTAYEVGASTVSPAPAEDRSGSNGGTSVTLNVEGDDALVELIRDHAELVVEENENSKQARIARS